MRAGCCGKALLTSVMWPYPGTEKLAPIPAWELTAHHFWKSRHLWLAVIHCAGVTNCPWPRWHLKQLRSCSGDQCWGSAFLCAEWCTVRAGLVSHLLCTQGGILHSERPSGLATCACKITSEDVQLSSCFYSTAWIREELREYLGLVRACSYHWLRSARHSHCSEDFANVLPSLPDCSALLSILVSNQQIYMWKKPENNSV